MSTNVNCLLALLSEWLYFSSLVIYGENIRYSFALIFLLYLIKCGKIRMDRCNISCSRSRRDGDVEWLVYDCEVDFHPTEVGLEVR